MIRIMLVVMLTVILVGSWGSPGFAGEPYSLSRAYNMDKAERGFKEPPKARPSASVIAFDAILGRPLGLATTVAGTGVFVVTLPFSAASQSVDTAAWGLVGAPGGWTFVRPMGRGDTRFEEQGIFR
jgi:hypothetical protein